MGKNLQTRILIIIGVLAAMLFFSFPLDKRINLGLDLKGGMHLVLKVETEKLEPKLREDAVLRAIEILRNRIDSLGVGETSIQRQGEDQIIIQLPGVTDRDRALQIIGKVAQLEFSLVNDDPDALKQALEGKVPAGYLLKYTKDDQKPVLIKERPALKGEAIHDARVDFDSTGFNLPRISLTFNARGAKQFADLTREHVNERLAILLDGEVYSAPNIREPILDGSAEITGQFTFEEASILSLALRSGSLPAPMRVEEERTIGPLLGKDSIMAGVNASILGVVLVFIFMCIYYFWSGIIASSCLFLNLLLIIGTMGFLSVMMPGAQVTLTLPGIAGIILTLGMAVDANVLINERIREELAIGRPVGAAVANGFNKAFTAIFDSNITTLLAAFMLFQFGSGPIKGFAVTLAIGLVSSLFTAVFVSRTIFQFLLEMKMIKNVPMLRMFSNTKIDFVAARYAAITISLVLIGWGLFTAYQKKEAAYGIDFAGGQIQEYRFAKPIASDDLRAALKEKGMGDAIIQRFNKDPQNVIIRTSGDTYDTVVGAFKEKFADNSFEILRIEKVGPVVGKHLRERAVWAIVLSLIGILVYVAFRFKHWDFATAGVIALLHDVLITYGLLIVMGRQIDLLVVTALLTIAGYSINDTIVIYDRIRENMPKMRKSSLKDLINVSLNQTLSRTIITNLVTFLVVLALFFKGGEVLNTFALALVIGFFAGTYSTIFIASPLVLAFNRSDKK